jgi:hypothetical protein
MTEEPELIDIYAMFILMGLVQKPVQGRSRVDIAYEAFEQARAMVDVREDFIKERRK